MKFVFCGDYLNQSPARIIVDSKIKALLASADYAAVNFEAPIEGYGKPIHKSGPSITQSIDSPSFLESLGINIIQLANNHIMDMGAEACKATIKSFSEKVTIIGAGTFNDTYKIVVLEKKGLKVGLLNLVHQEFGTLGIDASGLDYGTAWINHPIVNKTILSAKEFCDILIVLPHAGVEDIVAPLPEWRYRYREFIEMGADAVIASHPHTPQGWENYKGKMIFYSLGNFFFFRNGGSCHGKNWFKGLLVELEIDANKNLAFQIYNTVFDNKSVVLETSNEINIYNNYLCNLLVDDRLYQEYINNSLLSLWPDYKLYLLRGISAITLRSNWHTFIHSAYGLLKGADICMMLNNFQCESHRWAIERILKLIKKD